MLTIRRTTAADTDAVLDFYSKMIDEMVGTEFDIMWKHDEHPSNAFLRESTEKGYTIIGLTDEGEIATAMVVDHECAPGYEKAPWHEPDAPLEEVGIVHAVATRPQFHGQGFARQLVNAAIELSREAGLRALRLDTLQTNVRGQGLYDTCGFTNLGIFPIFYDDLGTIDLVMYEYVL